MESLLLLGGGGGHITAVVEGVNAAGVGGQPWAPVYRSITKGSGISWSPVSGQVSTRIGPSPD